MNSSERNNDIIYNYEYIEEELGKLILPGLKRFNPEGIKFVEYKDEEFKKYDNNYILTKFKNKYKQNQITEKEKQLLKEEFECESFNKINEIFTFLKMLMSEIISIKYDKDMPIYDLVVELPIYFKPKDREFLDFLEKCYRLYRNDNPFTISSLLSIFDYLEELFWPQFSKNIHKDYTLLLPEEIKKQVLDYFKNIDNNNKHIINITNFTLSLRRLISRYLVDTKKDKQINPNLELYIIICKNEFWNKDIYTNIEFNKELFAICNKNIKIGNAFNLYKILDGDTILKKEEKQKGKKQRILKKIDDNIFNNLFDNDEN